jgi:hypothetical protein
VLVRESGWMHATLGIGLAALLVAAVPTARLLSRRLLLNGSIALGWTPLLWWLPAPASVQRSDLVLAVGFGGLALWLLVRDSRSRLRSLLPRCGPSDAALPVIAAIVAWATWPLLTTASGDRTLNLLIKSGWDHAPHFAMFETIRREGLVSSFLPVSPDGSPWVGASYPQHFHALLVEITELAHGSVGSVSQEVLFYGQALALLTVTAAVLLAAGVLQLPSTGRRPWLSVPLAAFLVATFVMGPGAIAFTTGWPNFVLAATAVALSALLAASVSRYSTATVAALCGLVILTVHTWVPLAALTCVCACTALAVRSGAYPLPRTPGAWARMVLVLLTAGGACLSVVVILRASGAGDAVAAGGAAEFSISQVVLALGVALAFGMAPFITRVTSPREIYRWAPLAAPVTAVAMLLAFAAYQLATSGELTYYFGKLATGCGLAGFAFALVAMDRTLDHGRVRPARGVVSAAVAVVAAAAAFQTWGYVGPQPSTPLAGPAPLLGYRATSLILTSGPSGESNRLLAAARRSEKLPLGTSTYVAGVVGDPIPALADQWKRALATDWTSASDETLEIMRTAGTAFTSPEQVTDVVTRLLREDPQRVVIIERALLLQIREKLAPGLRERVLAV